MHIAYKNPGVPFGDITKKVADDSQNKISYIGRLDPLASGIIYISLIGMVATLDERAKFIELNNQYNYRKRLIYLLKNKAYELGIENDIVIAEGGTVGVGIYPKEYI